MYMTIGIIYLYYFFTGAVKTTNPRQGVKPPSMVKGLATSKLILTKKSKTGTVGSDLSV